MSSATPTRPAPAKRTGIALGSRACLAGQRVAFATATEWVARLGDAQRHGRLDEELRKLLWIPLLILDLSRHRDYADVLCAATATRLLAAGFVTAPAA